MDETTLADSKTLANIENISRFIDSETMGKIINKLTDYADIIPENKLASLINYKYDLNSTQINKIIGLLIDIQAVSKIYNIALKGLKDLDIEYISNIFSDTAFPNNISSYISIRTIIENRLSHQTQQYNINMNKNNTSMAMPLNELKNHVKIYKELSKDNVTVSTKTQHGFIAASLHDAYVILMDQQAWWNDRTYRKFFFDDSEIRNTKLLLVSGKKIGSLAIINGRITETLNYMEKYKTRKSEVSNDNPESSKASENESEHKKNRINSEAADAGTDEYNDRMLATPFGRQYGKKIDAILDDIFGSSKKDILDDIPDSTIHEKATSIYKIYTDDPDRLIHEKNDIITVVEKLIHTDYGIKTFAEKYIHPDKKIPFNMFFTDGLKNELNNFITEIFIIYFKEKFSTIFRVIRSTDMIKFACAFILKRIYSKYGKDLGVYGFYLLRSIGKVGGIKV